MIAPDDLAEEVRHLLAFGVWPERIAKQLGTNRKALIRRLSRHGHNALANRLEIYQPFPPECGVDGIHGPCRTTAVGADGVCRLHRKTVAA